MLFIYCIKLLLLEINVIMNVVLPVIKYICCWKYMLVLCLNTTHIKGLMKFNVFKNILLQKMYACILCLNATQITGLMKYIQEYTRTKHFIWSEVDTQKLQCLATIEK